MPSNHGPSVEKIAQTEPLSAAFGVWQAMLAGRLRIVAWYDREGRRYVIARPCAEIGGKGLTERERRAVELRSSGAALKVIADELRVSLSTAARALARGRETLGFASDVDLAAVLGHAGR